MKKVFLYSIMVLMPHSYWEKKEHYIWLGEQIKGCFPGQDDNSVLNTTIGKYYMRLMRKVIGF